MGPYDPGIRLYVEVPLAEGADVPLSGGQAHYLRNVMRVAPGDTVLLFNGRDGEWRGEIGMLGKKAAAATCRAKTRPQKNAPDLWLLFAPLKRGRIDYLAQKASELGVSTLWPIVTRYTAARRVNMDRLRANGIEAAEQCARLDVPRVIEPLPLADALADWPEDRHILLCDESRTDVSLAETLRRAADEQNAPWAVLVGPEGGFAPEELDLLHGMPRVLSVGLGERLLRADTAAVAALALWQAILGDWG